MWSVAADLVTLDLLEVLCAVSFSLYIYGSAGSSLLSLVAVHELLLLQSKGSRAWAQ